MRIFKFGGASVKNAEAIRNLQYILSNHGPDDLLVVVSALGKTTNKLEVLAKLAYDRQAFQEILQEIVDDHIEIAEQLMGEVPEPVKNRFESLNATLLSPKASWSRFYDQVVPYGELLSTTLIVQFLQRTMEIEWLDARDYIVTSDHFTRAKVDMAATESKMAAIEVTNRWYLTQGFIGKTNKGLTTTLGREGSDYSAALFAQFLCADELVVWKDVPGIMTGDPKLSTAVQKYDRLSYRRAVEMTYYGAKVIHPKTMAPLAKANIPMTVRSFLDLEKEGTLITSDDDLPEEVLPTTVYRYNQVLVSLRMPDKSTIDHLLMSDAMRDLSQLDIQINLMQHSALSFSFCFDEDKLERGKMREVLGPKYALLENDGLHLVTHMNYSQDKQHHLSESAEVLLEQRTRHHYRVLYKP